MLRIAVEPLTEALLAEGAPLLSDNWIASGSFDPELPLDPNLPAYLKLQELGLLLVVTLRQAGVLQGYVVYAVARSMHHQRLKVAHGEAIYVAPAFRDEASTLLKVSEAELKKRGVDRVGWFVVPGTKAHAFLHRHGFVDDEVVLEKRL